MAPANRSIVDITDAEGGCGPNVLMWLFRKEHTDPSTGDTIGRSERLSLFAQAIMRKWAFVFAYSALTFFWWTHPTLFGDHPGNDARWQDWASYMALLIESLVGIGMFVGRGGQPVHPQAVRPGACR